MSSNADYVIAEYFAHVGYELRRVSVEEGHTKACLASSAISAVQNFRDDAGISDFDFHMFLRDSIIHVAQGYLADELSDCKCPQKVVEESHHWELHYQLASTGQWTIDTFYATLTGVAANAAELIELGVASRAYVAYADFHEGNAKPAMWVSINWAN